GERLSPDGSIYISQQNAESMFVENRMFDTYIDGVNYGKWTDAPGTDPITNHGNPDPNLRERDEGVTLSGTTFTLPNGILLKHGLIKYIHPTLDIEPEDLRSIRHPESKAQNDTPDWDSFVDNIVNLTAGETASAIKSLLIALGLWDELLDEPTSPSTYAPPVDTYDYYPDSINYYKDELRPDIERMLEKVFWQNLGRKIWTDSLAVASDAAGRTELDYFTDKYLDGTYDMSTIEKWLTGEEIPADQSGYYNSYEHDKSDTFKTNVIYGVGGTDNYGVEDFLDSYVANGCNLDSSLDSYTFAGLFDHIQSIDTVTLTSQDVDDLVAYLESTGLHFGRSAYDSLFELLYPHGDYDINDSRRLELAKSVIIVEALLGLLNPNRQHGMALVISMYSLTLIADAKGVTVGGYDLLRGSDFSEAIGYLEGIIGSMSFSEGVIIYTNEGHFMTVVGVDPDFVDPETSEVVGKVTIVEHGETRTLTLEEFEEIWSGKIICEESAIEAVLTPEELVEKRLSVLEMQRTKGGCFGVVALIIAIATAVAEVAAVVIAVVAAVAEIVVGIVALVAEAVGGLLVIVGDAVAGLGAGMMKMGEAWMAFGGLGEGGLMSAGFTAMKTGGLWGFISGTAMVVAGAAIYVAGAVMWAAGAVLKVTGEFISNVGNYIKDEVAGGLRNLAKGIKAFRTTGITNLKTRLLDPTKWGFLKDGTFAFKHFMSNLALTARVYSAVKRTVDFVQDIRKYGWGTAFKNLGMSIAYQIAANVAYTFVAQNILPEGTIPGTTLWLSEADETMTFSDSIKDALTLGWSSVGSAMGTIAASELGRLALTEATGIVADVVAGEVVNRVLDKDASPWARFGLRVGINMAIHWGSLSFGGYEDRGGVTLPKDLTFDDYLDVAIDELSTAAFTEWSSQASASLSEIFGPGSFLAGFMSELASTSIMTIGKGAVMGWNQKIQTLPADTSVEELNRLKAEGYVWNVNDKGEYVIYKPHGGLIDLLELEAGPDSKGYKRFEEPEQPTAAQIPPEGGIIDGVLDGKPVKLEYNASGHLIAIYEMHGENMRPLREITYHIENGEYVLGDDEKPIIKEMTVTNYKVVGADKVVTTYKDVELLAREDEMVTLLEIAMPSELETGDRYLVTTNQQVFKDGKVIKEFNFKYAQDSDKKYIISPQTLRPICIYQEETLDEPYKYKDPDTGELIATIYSNISERKVEEDPETGEITISDKWESTQLVFSDKNPIPVPGTDLYVERDIVIYGGKELYNNSVYTDAEVDGNLTSIYHHEGDKRTLWQAPPKGQEDLYPAGILTGLDKDGKRMWVSAGDIISAYDGAGHETYTLKEGKLLYSTAYDTETKRRLTPDGEELSLREYINAILTEKLTLGDTEQAATALDTWDNSGGSLLEGIKDFKVFYNPDGSVRQIQVLRITPVATLYPDVPSEWGFMHTADEMLESTLTITPYQVGDETIWTYQGTGEFEFDGGSYHGTFVRDDGSILTFENGKLISSSGCFVPISFLQEMAGKYDGMEAALRLIGLDEDTISEVVDGRGSIAALALKAKNPVLFDVLMEQEDTKY
ncbi:MAG: hypothetical protein KAV87_30275, partial [Desulfobacteraceae bacterium]|nr:hypothetical protein [Desulfobacteraceae bacterium]